MSKAKEIIELATVLQVGSIRVERVGDDYAFRITNTRTKQTIDMTSDEGFELRDLINEMDCGSK